MGGQSVANGATSFLNVNGMGLGGNGGAGGAGGGYAGASPPEGYRYEDRGQKQIAGHLGNPVITQGYDWKEYGDRMQDYDTQEGKDYRVGEVYREGTNQRENARSNEQQTGNYPYYNWNLAQENPRGNLNRMNYETTLRMSRLADAVNNRLHWDPGTASTIMTRNGPATLGSGTGDVRRWEPIETEETRQMEANRDIDRQAREAGVDLQSRIQAYPQEVQEQMDREALKLRSYIAQMDDDFISWFQKNVIQTEYNNSWQNFFQETFQKYITELGLDTKSRIYRELMSLTMTAQKEFSYLFAPGYVPSPVQNHMLDRMVNNIIADDRYSLQARMLFVQGLQYMMGVMAAIMEAKGHRQIFANNLPVFGGLIGGGGSSGGSDWDAGTQYDMFNNYY